MKKAPQYSCASLCLHAAVAPWCTTDLSKIKSFQTGAHCTGPGVGRSEHHSGHTCLPDGSRAHEARLQRHDKDTPSQPVIPCGRRGAAQCQDLGVSRRIMQAFGFVMRTGKRPAVRIHHQRPYGHLSDPGGPSRQTKRPEHERTPARSRGSRRFRPPYRQRPPAFTFRTKIAQHHAGPTAPRGDEWWQPPLRACRTPSHIPALPRADTRP